MAPEYLVSSRRPEWPIARGPNSQKIVRAARPIYGHPIQPTWLKTASAIADLLDLLQVKWNTINPLAYANAGEAAWICEFVITIAVQPFSLLPTPPPSLPPMESTRSSTQVKIHE